MVLVIKPRIACIQPTSELHYNSVQLRKCLILIITIIIFLIWGKYHYLDTSAHVSDFKTKVLFKTQMVDDKEPTARLYILSLIF